MKIYIVTDNESILEEKKVFSNEIDALKYANEILNRKSLASVKVESFEVEESKTCP